MQVIDRDKVVMSIAHGDLMLFQLVSGTFQFGTGSEAKIVQSVDEVKEFPKAVQDMVAAWLNQGGVNAAKQDKRARLIAENARREGAGMLDSLVAAVGGDELKGELMEVLTAYLKQRGTIPQNPVTEVQKLDHGSIVVDAEGNRSFEPNDAEMDAAIRREMEADEQEAAGEDLPAEQVSAPAGEASGDMSDEVNTQKRPRRRR